MDDAYPLSLGQVELEIGLSHTRLDGGSRQQALPTITTAYGIIDKLEIGLGIQRSNHDHRGEAPVRGFEDLHLLTKSASSTKPNFYRCIFLGCECTKAKGLSKGRSDQAFTFIMSKIHDVTGLHLNLGYLLVNSPRGAKLKNRLRGGMAADYVISPAVALRW